MESSSDATIVVHPTPYADVNVVLHDFAVQIQALLGGHCSGMYLYGSLALGDFDPHTSDIDFLVVTDTDLADDLIQGLADMHRRFNKSGSPWSEKIEAAYIPQHALNHTAPTEATYPRQRRRDPSSKGLSNPAGSFNATLSMSTVSESWDQTRAICSSQSSFSICGKQPPSSPEHGSRR